MKFLKILLLAATLNPPPLFADTPEICAKPFEAVCSQEVMSTHQNVLVNLKLLIKKIRWEALNDLGYSNWKEFYNARFKASQLEAPKYSLKVLKRLRGISYSFGSDGLVPQVNSCKNQIEAYYKDLGYNSSLGDFRKVFPKVLETLRKTRKGLLSRAFESPKYLFELYNSVLTTHCQSGKYAKKENLLACTSWGNLKTDFLLAQKFEKVDESLKSKVIYLLGEFADYNGTTYNTFVSEIKRDLKYSSTPSLQKRISSSYTAKAFCAPTGTETVIQKVTTGVFSEYLTAVFGSKKVLKRVLEAIYTEEVMSLMNSEFNNIKKDLLKVTSSWAIEDSTKAKLVNTLENLHLNWPQLPSDDFFEKNNDTGLLVLDPEKIPMGDMMLQSFIDPELNILTTTNAFYIPNFQIGEQSIKTQVNIMPYFLELYKYAPEGVRYVMTHEAAHSIDYNMAKINGLDELQNFYKPLIDCYSSTESFNMDAEQSGETLSDLMASEVMSMNMPNNLSLDIQFAKDSLIPFCIFDSFSDQMKGEGGAHPESYFRISAIALANPSVRRQLKCERPQKLFKNCGY